MKIQRWYRNGSEFFSDEHGKPMTRARAEAIDPSLAIAATPGNRQTRRLQESSSPALFIKRDSQGMEYLVDKDGKLWEPPSHEEAARRGTRTSESRVFMSESSAADTAAAKSMVGHFVRDNSAGYGSTGMYQVTSVDDDGSATLAGPIGKGGTRTVSHSDLVKNHTDLGDSTKLSQVSEAYQAERFERRKQIHMAAGLSQAEAVIAARGRQQ